MGVAGSLMTISILWWLVFFALLPFGIRSHLEEGSVVPGTDPSAPTTPRLLRKAVIAFVVALVLWAALFSVIEFNLISVDDIPLPSGIRWN